MSTTSVTPDANAPAPQAPAPAFQLSDSERALIEQMRANAEQDTEQPVCTCNADGAAHRHTSNGIKRA